jgi:hypothetical protein
LATNYLIFSFLSVVSRYSNKLITEGGLEKIEMLLQKQKTRCSKLNEARIVLKRQKFEDLQTEIFVDIEGF